MVWRYSSVLGGQGNIEIDLNFIHRQPLLPTVMKSSVALSEYGLSEISVLDIHELAAGKLAALIDRCAARDIFDAHYLLCKLDLNFKTLKTLFILYSGMSRKADLRKIEANQIQCDFKEFQNRLLPMLRVNEYKSTADAKLLHKKLLEECQFKLSILMSLEDDEYQFLTKLFDQGEIDDGLIDDMAIAKNASVHPALLWTAYNVKRNLMEA